MHNAVSPAMVWQDATLGLGQHMRRREFISLLGATAAWPLAARAQQSAMPVVGFLNSGSSDATAYLVRAFRQGLLETTYVEGKDVKIEYRWAEGRYNLLPELARDLVRLRVAVIAALGTSAPGLAAKAITSTIPIVFTSGDDPVKTGLVSSLNHPGSNITGVHLFLTGLSAKKVGLLHDLLPQASLMGICLNSSNENAEVQARDLAAAGKVLGIQMKVVEASSEREIDAAFSTFTQQQVDAIIVGSDPFYLARRAQFIKLAAEHALPAFYPARTYVADGGLMSYGTSLSEAYRQAGTYVGKILKGAKPAELPVLQPTKFELVINLKTANTLGLTIPPGVLAIADEVIE
jgi:putative ABC transport system substrate-binding protein